MPSLTSWKAAWRRAPKPVRVLAWTLAAVAGAYGVLALVLALLIPPERLATWVTPRIETALGAPVDVGGVRLRVFPAVAIRVERLTVPNPQGFSDRPLFRVDALDLRPRLLPLLSREIVVAEVRLLRPRLLIESNPDGERNVSALTAGRPRPDTTLAKEAGAERGGPAGFAVNRLVVSDGIVLYEDLAEDKAFRVGDLDAKLALSGDLSGGERFEASAHVALGDLQARFAGSDTVTALPPLALDVDAGARLNPDSAHLREVRVRWGEIAVAGSGTLTRFRSSERAIAVTLEATGLEAAKLVASLDAGDALQGYSARGAFDVRLAANGPIGGGRRPRLSGELSFRNAGLAAPTGRDLLAGLTGVIRLEDETLTSEAIRGRLLGRPAALRFTSRGFLDPSLDARWTGELDLGALAALREGGAEMSGLIAGDLQVSGKPRRPPGLSVTGPLTLKEVVVRGPTPAVPVRIAAGTLRFTGQGLRSDDLALALGRSDLTLSFEARNAVEALAAPANGSPTPAAVTLSARSRRLDWTELFPEKPDEITYSQLMWARLADRPVDGRTVDQVAEEQRFTITALPLLEAQGRAVIDTFIQTNLRATNVSLDVRLQDGVLRLTDLRASVYGGRARGEVTVDFRNRPPYPASWSFVAESLQAAAFLARFTGLGQAVSGTLTMQVGGEGTLDRYLLPERDAFKTDVRGLLVNGGLQDWGPTNALAAFLKNDRLKTVRVQRWVGGLEIVGSHVRLRDWSLTGERLAATVAGAFGLDGTLDAALRLQLDSAFAHQLGGGAVGAMLLQGASSWLALQMKGPARNPSLSVDHDAMRQIAAGAVQQKIAEERKEVREQVEQKIEEEVGDRLRRLLGGGRDTTPRDTTKRDTTRAP